MPGFTFPWMGRLGLTSPSSRPLARPSVLRSAKTTASPSRVASLIARFPIPLLTPGMVCVPFGSPTGMGVPACAWPFVLPVGRCPVVLQRGVGGSPKFPGYPCVHMPRSQSPVVSGMFAITHPGFMPSSRSRLSAFPATTAGYPCFPYGPQLYTFRRSVTRPTHSLHLAPNTPSWICTQVHCKLGGYSRLVGLGRFPVLTHWVTSTNFTESVPSPRFWI